MIEQSDEEIVLQVQKGDVEAFGTLMKRYEPKLTRYARKFLLDGGDAEDLVQEVFIKAYMNVRGFDPARRFSPWIYRIAHNVFVNAIKKRGTDKVSFFDLDVVFPHAVAKQATDDEAQKRELRESLDAHLSKIDRKYREPIVLYYYEDMDYQGIAETLQIPVSTVGVRLQRGKAALKKLAAKTEIII
jgi:RNA polymerase sigma-70 factor (ECF subfamily)